MGSKLSILVLPFVNLSGDPTNDYVADSLTADLISDLARVRAVSSSRATPRSSTRAKRSTAKRVGRELGVRYVLEGVRQGLLVVVEGGRSPH